MAKDNPKGYDPTAWEDLDEEQSQEANDETLKKASEVDNIFHGAYAKAEGKLLIDYLEKRYITDYTVAAPGMDPLEIGIRQGRQTLVREILNAIDRASEK